MANFSDFQKGLKSVVTTLKSAADNAKTQVGAVVGVKDDKNAIQLVNKYQQWIEGKGSDETNVITFDAWTKNEVTAQKEVATIAGDDNTRKLAIINAQRILDSNAIVHEALAKPMAEGKMVFDKLVALGNEAKNEAIKLENNAKNAAVEAEKNPGDILSNNLSGILSAAAVGIGGVALGATAGIGGIIATIVGMVGAFVVGGAAFGDKSFGKQLISGNSPSAGSGDKKTDTPSQDQSKTVTVAPVGQATVTPPVQPATLNQALQGPVKPEMLEVMPAVQNDKFVDQNMPKGANSYIDIKIVPSNPAAANSNAAPASQRVYGLKINDSFTAVASSLATVADGSTGTLSNTIIFPADKQVKIPFTDNMKTKILLDGQIASALEISRKEAANVPIPEVAKGLNQLADGKLKATVKNEGNGDVTIVVTSANDKAKMVAKGKMVNGELSINKVIKTPLNQPVPVETTLPISVVFTAGLYPKMANQANPSYINEDSFNDRQPGDNAPLPLDQLKVLVKNQIKELHNVGTNASLPTKGAQQGSSPAK